MAQRQQAAYEEAQSALLRAQILQQLGKTEAEDELKSAQSEMGRIAKMVESANRPYGAQDPLST